MTQTMERAAPFEPGLEMLNCGHGHLEFKLRDATPAEVEAAKVAVEQMLQRGYTVLCETADGRTRRVKKFDPKREVYIVETGPAEGEPSTAKTRKKTDEVPMREARTTGVGRQGGG